MFRIILFTLIVVPAMEIGLLILSGKTLGIWPTVILIITTGIVGAWLAKKQGLKTIMKAREQMQYGHVPGDAIIDGLCVLIGGLLLLSPGFVTDIVGFFLLLPFTRVIIKPFIGRMLTKMINNSNFIIFRR